MPKKKSSQNKKLGAPVHFVFESHADRDPYLPKGSVRNLKKFKSYIIEAGRGCAEDIHSYYVKVFSPGSEKLLRKKLRESKYQRTRYLTMKALLDAGVKLRVGEHLRSPKEIKTFEKLWNKIKRREEEMHNKPTIENIKQYFRAFGKLERLRHKLVLRTIKEEIKKGNVPILARYGHRHSILSKLLANEGIKSTRYLRPQIFFLDSQVIRKIALGIEPSDAEFKRGFISIRNYTNPKVVKAVLGKRKLNNLNDVSGKEWAFYALVEYELLSRLSECELDKIIAENDPWLMFTLNGLPKKPSRKQILEFLNKHSTHWKRMSDKEKREVYGISG